MQFIIIHVGFPGQFENIVRSLLGNGHRVHGIGLTKCVFKHERFSFSSYKILAGNTKGIFPPVDEIETKMIRGVSIKAHLIDLKQKGMEPDAIIMHPGWGEALYVKHVWDKAPVITYQEFYYHLRDSDLDYDNPGIDQRNEGLSEYRMELKNALALQSLSVSKSCISPTLWQKSLFPTEYRNKICVYHDGIDMNKIRMILSEKEKIARSRVLFEGRDYITYAARCLEPYRGFHVFMRSLPYIQQAYPELEVIIIGSEGRGAYGSSPLEFATWKLALLEELKGSLNMSRIHFMDTLPYDRYIEVLVNSRVHTYLSYPFVLSWGFLVACSIGIPVVANKIRMIEEASCYFNNCQLVDEFSHVMVAKMINDILDEGIGKNHELVMPSIYDARKVSSEVYRYLLNTINA